MVTLIQGAPGAVTINDVSPFFLSATWAPSQSNTLTLVNFAGVWVEVARSDN